jgi:signal transduction histidine kinase
MSSNNLKRFFRTIGFRISVRHTLLLLFSAVLLLLVVHYFLSLHLTQNDHRAIQTELKRIAEAYSSRGVAAVQQEIAASGNNPRFYIRVADQNGHTLAQSDPDDFEDYDLGEIERTETSTAGLLKLSETDTQDPMRFIEGLEVLEIATIAVKGDLVQVGKTSEERKDFISRTLLTLGIIIIPFFLLIATFLSHRTLSPLRQMISTVESIQQGQLHRRVPVSGTGDELDELARLFNGMLERIEKLIKGMQDSLDSVAHDLRTPITRLRATAEMAMQSNGVVQNYREALADCLEETDEILSMLETLMDISEAQTGVMKLHPERVSVSKLIEDSLDLYRYVAEDRGVDLESACNQELFVNVDPRRIRQALANLVDNAVKYTEKGGRIRVEAHQSDHEAIISVSDTGPGIAPDDLPRIWERLYRSSNAHTKKGIGLGLSLVRAIVQSHGGEVQAASEVDKGSVFTIHLPLSS